MRTEHTVRPFCHSCVQRARCDRFYPHVYKVHGATVTTFMCTWYTVRPYTHVYNAHGATFGTHVYKVHDATLYDTHGYTFLTPTNGTFQMSQTGICKRYAGITTNRKCISSGIDDKGLVEIQRLALAEDIGCSTGPWKHNAGITANKTCIS